MQHKEQEANNSSQVTKPMIHINTFIIDDEPDAGQLLDNLLKDFAAINVTHVFTDALIALDAAIMEKPQLLFLDIEMPEMSGMEFLKQVNKFSSGTQVIFVT